jgi:hypothetical protein
MTNTGGAFFRVSAPKNPVNENLMTEAGKTAGGKAKNKTRMEARMGFIFGVYWLE